MFIVDILLGKRRVRGFELDGQILTVFEQFGVLWPLDVSTPNADAMVGCSVDAERQGTSPEAVIL